MAIVQILRRLLPLKDRAILTGPNAQNLWYTGNEPPGFPARPLIRRPASPRQSGILVITRGA